MRRDKTIGQTYGPYQGAGGHRQLTAHVLIDYSELELEGELDRARAADLVQRIQTAALASAAKRVVQHHRGLPELR